MNFSCPRTCPDASPWCRFNPIFRAIGGAAVHSHTIRVKVELKDPPALRAAVEAMGGKWLGQGTHRLYERAATGLGFTLPGWQYPLVLAGAELAYDDYHGRWGNVADLEKLKGQYAIGAAQQSALALGWLTERTAEGLTIYHPSGGLLSISPAGTIDTTGFSGSGCHDARTELGLERFGLVAGEALNKTEFNETQAQVQIPG